MTTSSEARAFDALAACFHEAVPGPLRECGPLTATVAQQVLLRQGIEAQLVPCQLWYASPGHEHAVGYTGRDGDTDWDGHVICLGAGHFIDLSVPRLADDVPPFATGPCLAVRSQAIAICHLSPTERLWWHHPPKGADLAIPPQIGPLVACLVDAVDERMKSRLERGMLAAAS